MHFQKQCQLFQKIRKIKYAYDCTCTCTFGCILGEWNLFFLYRFLKHLNKTTLTFFQKAIHLHGFNK